MGTASLTDDASHHSFPTQLHGASNSAASVHVGDVPDSDEDLLLEIPLPVQSSSANEIPLPVQVSSANEAADSDDDRPLSGLIKDQQAQDLDGAPRPHTSKALRRIIRRRPPKKVVVKKSIARSEAGSHGPVWTPLRFSSTVACS